jgi:nitroreductase
MALLQRLSSGEFGRRTVNFEPELPAGWHKALRRAVEDACYPRCRGRMPWRFHLLDPRRIRGVCELNAQLVASKKGEEAGATKLARWLAMPGWLVVTQVLLQKHKHDLGADKPGSGLLEDYAACCCAVQNLCLLLHSEGIGTKWTFGPVNFDERFNGVAGIPEYERVVGTLWFGTPADVPKPPSKHLSVDEVLQVSE